jgi:hypothetical protein
MLERDGYMVKAINNQRKVPSKVHHVAVQDFEWDEHIKSYDCILCVWGLGYLTKAES